MSQHYIIDGYNLIHSSELLSTGPLREQRDKLLRFIEEKHPQGSIRNRVTVVFDGQPDVSSPPHGGPTAVLFSPGPSADLLLKDLVDRAANPAEIVVVTNDKEIRRWVRGVKARIMSCEDFLSAGTGKSAGSSPQERLDKDSEEDINDELKRLWKLK